MVQTTTSARAVCGVGATPLKGAALGETAATLATGWRVVEEHHLEKEFRFADFRQALDFTIRVGELAEQMNHHPDIHLAWGKVTVTIWTHKINGLTNSDFVLAAAIEQAR